MPRELNVTRNLAAAAGAVWTSASDAGYYLCGYQSFEVSSIRIDTEDARRPCLLDARRGDTKESRLV